MQAADQVRLEAKQANVKSPPTPDRFTVQGRSIKDRQDWPGVTLSLPDLYRPPRRTVIDVVKHATSVEAEPRTPPKAA